MDVYPEAGGGDFVLANGPDGPAPAGSNCLPVDPAYPEHPREEQVVQGFGILAELDHRSSPSQGRNIRDAGDALRSKRDTIPVVDEDLRNLHRRQGCKGEGSSPQLSECDVPKDAVARTQKTSGQNGDTRRKPPIMVQKCRSVGSQTKESCVSQGHDAR